AAPTGKAAKRLHVSIQNQLRALEGIPPLERQLFRRISAPATLHRLLGYSPSDQRFRHHRERPLPQRWVIVDEVSMVDLELMGHLLRALDDRSSLVLLGDPDQLPSIDAGAVLRDLVPDVCAWDGPW